MSDSTIWESLPVLRGQADREVLDLMRNCPVFQDIPVRGLRIILDRCHIRHYKENEHVFRTGEPGLGMYIILEGQVEIYRNEGDYRRQFAQLSAGDFFGEIALLEDLPRTAAARSASYSRLLGFFRPDLLTLFSRKPRLASVVLMNMARLTARRLIRTNESLEDCQRELNRAIQPEDAELHGSVIE
ncbi:MAG: cyclic nucleotide-binding domain-containing protein [Leptospiraceae bacterium]|nr:cyclic nucleotide-binding domain-containing protein [Leptospiraceae bacterium]